jgi:hypothetical protein
MELPVIRANYTQMMAIIGGLSAASSVISLIQHIRSISLWGVFSMYLKLYRDIAHPIVGFIPKLFLIKPPIVLIDLWTLSAIFMALTARAINLHKVLNWRTHAHTPNLGLLLVYVVLIYTFVAIPFCAAPIFLPPMLWSID